MPSIDDWAEAIALRISDEWAWKGDFLEDARLLQEILHKLFLAHPEECEKLIGTGIIEEDYFEPLLYYKVTTDAIQFIADMLEE